MVRINGATADSDAKFEATENALYQLVEDVRETILNGGAISPGSPLEPNELGEEMRMMILEMYTKHLSEDGKVTHSL